jgi:hypothetical protein
MSAADDPSDLLRADLLTDPGLPPDRVHYATGTLLGAEDFVAEQAYHRGRLGRALGGLYGHGTVAGLRVTLLPATPDTREQLVVEPGLALDRLGRLIELPRAVCIDLDRWLEALPADTRTGALHPKDPADTLAGIVVDVFARFVQCARGKTPAQAAGPFDALDYAVPSRIRDGCEIELVPRAETLPRLPQNGWPDLAAIADPVARETAFRDAALNAWSEPPLDSNGERRLAPLAEHVLGQDNAALWLARIQIPAAGDPPVRTPGDLAIDNASRAFVPAHARWIGV